MAKRFTNRGNVICLYGYDLVPRGTAADAKERAQRANEKFASLENEALAGKFSVPFSALAEWLKNNS